MLKAIPRLGQSPPTKTIEGLYAKYVDEIEERQNAEMEAAGNYLLLKPGLLRPQ